MFASCLIACVFCCAHRFDTEWIGREKYIQTGSLVADKRKIYLIDNGAQYIFLWLYMFYPTATPSNVYQQWFFCETQNWRNIWRVHFFHRLALHLLLSNRTVAVLILSCYIDKKCRSKYEIENRLINFHLPYHVLRMCKAFIRDIESNIASIVKFWI